MGTFSLRPNVSLNLYMSKSDDPGNNRSLISWNLQLDETVQQPTWNTDPVSSGTVSFSWWNGSTSPAIANFAFDFRPTALQSLSIGSGSFYVTHQSNGIGGTVSGYGTAAAPSGSSGLGTAEASNAISLTDYDRSPAFTTTNAPTPVIRGVAYSGQFTATNTSSYTRSSGTLPTGVSLNTSTGALTGTPTANGSFTFTIRANGAYEGSVSSTKTVVVNPPAPVFTDTTLTSPAIRGVAYSNGVSATDATSYSIFSGSLPAGLSLNTSTGAVTGTPTTLGTSTFVIRATNGTGSTNTPSRTIVINPPAPVFSDSTIAAIAIRGVAYTDGVAASDVGYGIVSPATNYSIASSSLPTGLNFNTTTGAITGTATTTFQTRTPVFRATNVTGSTDTPARSIVVNPPAPVFTDSTVSASATVGLPYSDSVAATDAVSYSVRDAANPALAGTLPAGLSLNTSTGAITGTPTTPGSTSFKLRATNVTGSTDTATRTITVISAVRVWVGPDPDDFVPGLVKVWTGPDNDDFATGIVQVWDGNKFAPAK